ncbi:class I SAM-dependent methyltransferase [Fulvivirga sp. 29W222]|uniref:Class I SAM-dependent methyltransferase n=1 Tax=Fulvivirga marina TaxID=2494733 RepID=A0A937G2Z4_9BACT|nr:class I SAM-dependent methyltransferase [Fulvivirga marina]MBL6449503.1 class I SAM-dependent methyltransferase [Fulvivirga marina]
MSKLHQLASYFRYWLNAVDKHSLQAPFIYELYTSVIKPNIHNDHFKEIESIRDQYKTSDQRIPIIDFGAGSKVSNNHIRQVKDIASTGLTKKKYSEVLYRLCNFSEAKNILELGTSLGVNTLYLAMSSTESRVTTFEGSPALCDVARDTFRQFGANNINIIEGNIDDNLQPFVDSSSPIDIAFIDANHRYKPTLSYFNTIRQKAHDQSCFIFDDIHWSKEMEKAWREIRTHYSVSLSIDLYQMGLVFFTPDLRKQHYMLQF